MKHYINAFSRYFEMGGRTTRREYWMFYLFHVIVLALCLLLDVYVGQNNGFPLFYTAYILFAFIPNITVAVRRMHDSGRSGWWVIVPVVNLVFLCWDSQLGSNEYGIDPAAVIQ